ncbi:glycoside hydrolase family 10 protein [Gemmatimonas phototrophica]|uniref:glycoside hydrolase family 10 protein n=1 Tax=Gemmatimonas phototrophica TaxID=1379270 RepID=UPI001EE77492|nr:family 10 glycosylhydrolase [Gemmatimonas phototrophica]
MRRVYGAGAVAVILATMSCGRGLSPAVPIPAPVAPAVGVASDSAAGRLDTAARRRTPAARGADKAPVRRAEVPQAVVSVDAPPVLREFRGVWVATVGNMDWPSKRTLSTEDQQAELRALFDRAEALKLNAVIFQVRPAGDALYQSSLEPWSEFLTGTQGKRPQPFWDPLAFAIAEAHARGMELHAWFNPYRAGFVRGKSPAAVSHIRRTNPALVKKYGSYLWMDPGEAAVRARTVKVIVDVVKRYDVDGIHLDDYFYPYPENDRRGRALPFPDATSYAKYRKSGGKLDRAEWRRENVNRLVRQLHDTVHATKPWVRFGISPFGIWRPGYPEQIRGFDAYEKLYADARKWLREGWVDYFTPQLYWPTTKVAQAYPVLLDWWASENVMQRHLWPGNFTSLAGGRGSTAFPVSDLLEQIRLTRLQPGASGNVHFSMTSFLKNQAGMNDTLQSGPYAAVALPPASPWLVAPPPPAPAPRVQRANGALQLRLMPQGRTAPWQWLVRLRTDTAWVTMVLPGATDRFTIPRDLAATKVTVSALNRVGTESSPVSLSIVSGSTSSSTGRF